MADVDEAELDGIFAEAEEHHEQYTEAQDRLEEVNEQLHDYVARLYDRDTIGTAGRNTLTELIEAGEYGEARKLIEEAIADARLEFDDDERDAFAKRFASEFEELTMTVEGVRTALLGLRAENDLTDDQLVSYIYGNHYDLTKSEIRTVLDTFGDLDESGLDTRDMARVLAAFNRDLAIESTIDVLEAIKEEAAFP